MQDNNQKFVIFDLDGTLIDSFECVLRCVNKALDDYDLPHVIIPENVPKHDVEIIFSLAIDIIQDRVTYEEFKNKFDSIHLDDIDGITPNNITESLIHKYYESGFAIVIVTNKSQRITDKICQSLFPDIKFLIIGREYYSPIKSDWKIIFNRLSDFNLCPGLCEIYIGDTHVDRDLANCLSIKYIDISECNSLMLDNEAKSTKLTNKLKRFIYEDKTSFRIVGIIILIVGLFSALYGCYVIYNYWNRIPSHSFNATMYCEGYSSDDSYCNLRLMIDAGSADAIQEDSLKENSNIIQIYNSDKYTENIPLDKFIYGKCNYLFSSHTDRFFNKISYYFLDYKVDSNISSKVHNKDYVGVINSNTQSMSYIENPYLFSDSKGTHATGSGVMGFCKGEGSGIFGLYINLLNCHPSLLSLWDISQANYYIRLNTNHIKCDTISIEFVGATDFSNMYPQPDKTTISGIEFYDPDKLSEISNTGVRFHADFIELQEMSGRRTFMLSGFVSLLISIMASLFINCFQKSST